MTLPEVWLCEKVMARQATKCVGVDIFRFSEESRETGVEPRVRGWSSSLIASEQVFGTASIHIIETAVTYFNSSNAWVFLRTKQSLSVRLVLKRFKPNTVLVLWKAEYWPRTWQQCLPYNRTENQPSFWQNIICLVSARIDFCIFSRLGASLPNMKGNEK